MCLQQELQMSRCSDKHRVLIFARGRSKGLALNLAKTLGGGIILMGSVRSICDNTEVCGSNWLHVIYRLP